MSSMALLGNQNPIVGRGREQALLREQLAATLAGCGRFVLVSGEAGIGKTMLVRDLVQHADQQGAVVGSPSVLGVYVLLY